MADNNPAPEPTAPLSTTDGQAPTDSSQGSSAPQVTPEETHRRQMQSKRDTAEADKDRLQEQVDQLTPHVAKFAQKEAVSDFMSNNKETYPDVTEADLITLGAFEPEECKQAADYIQGIYTKANNSALAKVQSGVNEELLTEAEREQQLNNLEKEDGGNKMSKFLNLKFAATKKG